MQNTRLISLSSLKLIYLLNLLFDSHQSSTDIPLGQFKELTLFGVYDPIFKVKVLYVFSPNFHWSITRTSLRAD